MIRTFATQVPRMASAAAAPRRVNRRLEVDLAELQMMQVLDEDLTLIDVRMPTELLTQEQIPGSLHVPLGNLKQVFQLTEEEWLERFNAPKPKTSDKNIVFYGRGKLASSAAVEIAHRLGYKKSRSYFGGWEEYAQANDLPFHKQKLEPQLDAFNNAPNVALPNAPNVSLPNHYQPELYYYPK